MIRLMVSESRFVVLAFLFAATATAQGLPDGSGRAETEKLCQKCHELARSVSLRQDRGGWTQTLAKMKAFGLNASSKEYEMVLDYLTANFAPEEVPRINVNKATAIELESGLSLRRSQAAAVLAYRAEHGDFKTLDDLKKVPLMDPEKIEEKKDRIAFQ